MKKQPQHLDIELLEKDNFIRQYVDVFLNRSGGYAEYKYCFALAILGILSDKKFVMHFNFGTIYTNIWLLILGKSSISGKSTTFSEGRNLLEQNTMITTIADMFSKEAIPQALSKNPHSPLINEEVAGLIDSIHRKGSYLCGLADEMCKFYDCPPVYIKQTTKETYEVKDMFVNCLWCTTGERFAESMSVTELDGGLFARFLFCSDETLSNPIVVPTRHADSSGEKVLQELGRRVLQLHKITSMVDSIELQFSEESLKKYNAWVKADVGTEENDHIKMIKTRMKVYIFKLAALYYFGSISFIDDVKKELTRANTEAKKNLKGNIDIFSPDTLYIKSIIMHIPDKYLDIAMQQVNDFFVPISVKVYEDVIKKNADSVVVKIIDALKTAKDFTLTKSELMQRLSGRISHDEVDKILSLCQEEGRIRWVGVKTTKGRSKQVITLLAPENQ